jgi:crossover junction endodeoxyribonuclease RusA
MEWRNKAKWDVPEKGRKIVLRYWVWWKDNRRHDVDNLTKVLQDSLTDVLYVDDRYVLPQAIDYSVDRANPRIEVELEVVA